MDIINIIDGYSSDRIAHIYRESKMNYKELKEKSNALSCFIKRKLENKKTPVLIYGHKDNLMLVSFLACIKSGYTYIPVDSSMPEERLKDIVEDSRTSLILNVSEKDISFNEKVIIKKHELEKVINDFMGCIPNKEWNLKPEETCYIIYTSGSTGKPKGVQIALKNLTSFIKWGLSICKLKEKETFMNQAPFSFDLSVMDLYLSLVSGSTLFSIDKDMISNLKELFLYLSKSNISIWVSTPSFAEMCLASEHFNENLLPNLRQALFCGEVLTNSCARRLYERFKKLTITNSYGPTECTVAVTSIDIPKGMCKNDTALPIGYVKKDCEIIIVDTQNKKNFTYDEIKENILGQGEKGEIFIIGDSVGVGYYNDLKATEAAFFSINENGTVKRGYRTGDEGYLKDNVLYYSGRIGFQVKLNGYRIEIEDIENNMRKISNVKNAVVIPIYKEEKIQYLASVVVLKEKFCENDYQTILKIKNDLKKHIPEYMIPRKIIIKESLPMNINGKVNRKLLGDEF